MARDIKSDFIAFTDGACWPNPQGDGGWGFLLIDKRTGERTKKQGIDHETTNNRMEMRAIIEVIYEVPEEDSVLILTDSKLMVNSFTRWIFGWESRGWIKADGEPPKNLDMLQEYWEAAHNRNIYYKWIPGHKGISGNEQADALATEARKEATKLRLNGGHNGKTTTTQEHERAGSEADESRGQEKAGLDRTGEGDHQTPHC